MKWSFDVLNMRDVLPLADREIYDALCRRGYPNVRMWRIGKRLTVIATTDRRRISVYVFDDEPFDVGEGFVALSQCAPRSGYTWWGADELGWIPKGNRCSYRSKRPSRKPAELEHELAMMLL